MVGDSYSLLVRDDVIFIIVVMFPVCFLRLRDVGIVVTPTYRRRS